MTTPNNKRLLGSQDLLTYYNLIPIYEKYVRPYPPPDRASKLDPTLHSYISDLPGKNDIEPDGFLFNLLRDPQIPDRGPPITKLDSDVLKEAYALKPGPIPGFDASILGTDDGAPSSGGTGPYLGTGGEKDIYGASAGEGEISGEKKHKKKKKKRKHSHEHEEDGHGHSEHKKKKKRKKVINVE
ncbi:hypothetical protein BDA99DRAFT_524675 [Phascolomyces articulosus]|uniref:Mediator of RNA polymerase II transcription subunit 19 n=1 Tax=Phascolomyces articulosus TaxID=60185 RepID=A0AAD5JPR3_9FUNG|nr:hypothetical protein BDA99DRAFT_524675 [Phascolomyces articulosus]